MPAAQPRWGYHELRAEFARRLVHGAGIRCSDLVVDVGAGTGVITNELLRIGARVIAVELHPGRAAWLRERFDGADCQVIAGDLAGFRWPARPFRVVANPPFARTAVVLRRLVSARALVRADLVVPAHVAARWSRGAGYGPVRCWTAARLPASAFRPAATQPTSVLALTPCRRVRRPGRGPSARGRE